MTGSAWIGILCVLAIGAGTSYTAMKKMSAPLPEYKKPEQGVAASPALSRSVEVVKKNNAPSVDRDWDSLWKNSLFQDDRTEDDATVTESTNAPQVNQNIEFELVGLARLGRKDAQVPVAIIVQSANNQRNRFIRRPGMPPNMNMPGNMPGRGPMPMPGRMQPGIQRIQPTMEQQANAQTEPADKSLYREGDTIAKTNYKVKSIIIEESKVILTQNGQETVLVLDEKNTNNSIRRENVKRQELALREKYKQADAKNTNATKTTQQQANPNVRENMPMGRWMPGGGMPPNFGRNMNGGQPGGMPQPPNFGGNMPGGNMPGGNMSDGRAQGGNVQPGGNVQGGTSGGGFQGNRLMHIRSGMNTGR
ncbi:MAG: hypothetical protein J5746_00865 [Victivallales bacterium]|nr:hypothetical protein [Victivallales bacterium]